jgi:hypothetical protein
MPKRRAFLKFALGSCLLASLSAAFVSVLLMPVRPAAWQEALAWMSPPPVPFPPGPAWVAAPPEELDGRQDLFRGQDVLGQYVPLLTVTPGELHGRVKYWPDRPGTMEEN